MSCYNPLIGIPSGVRADTGKMQYRILPWTDDRWRDLQDRPPLNGSAVKIPCGKCIGCRLDYSRQWANRCMLEAQYHDSVYFATITYNDKYVPRETFEHDGKLVQVLSLRKRHFQLFMKRLRKRFSEDKIRFFAAGEYGSETFRPHYHVILFGLHLQDLEPWQKEKKFTYFTSKSLTKAWSMCYSSVSKTTAPLVEDSWEESGTIYEPYGRIVVAPSTWETCAYTARYTAKKSNTFFSEFYEKFRLEAPFTLMSRRPGIGRQYYEDHPEIYDYRYINLPGQEGGMKFTAPKYFDRLLEQEDPEFAAAMKEDRRMIAMELEKAKSMMSTYGLKNTFKIEGDQKEAIAKMLRRPL